MPPPSDSEGEDDAAEPLPHHSVLKGQLVGYEGHMLLISTAGPTQCRAVDTLDPSDDATGGDALARERRGACRARAPTRARTPLPPPRARAA